MRVELEKVTAWVGRYPAILGLLAAVIVGQVLARVLEPYVEQSHGFGQVPIVAAASLVVGLVLAVIVIWLRVTIGIQLGGAARARALSLPAPASLPARYAVADPAAQLVASGLALLDLALLLFVQATLRNPVVPLSQDYVPRAWADTAFVVLVLVLALIILVKLYRAAGPVLILLMWWGLDRVVPTAGFVGARPAAESKKPTTRVPLAMPAAPSPPVAELEPTAMAPQRAEAEATAMAPEPAEAEPTVLAPQHADAEATIISERRREPPTSDPEATVVAPEAP